MLIYKINFSLLTFFSILINIFCGRGLKGRAGCRQTEVQTKSRAYAKELANRQTKSRTYAKNWRTKNRQEAGSANSGAYYIPMLTPDAASRPAASITRPTASLPLFPRNYGRGLVIYA